MLRRLEQYGDQARALAARLDPALELARAARARASDSGGREPLLLAALSVALESAPVEAAARRAIGLVDALPGPLRTQARSLAGAGGSVLPTVLSTFIAHLADEGGADRDAALARIARKPSSTWRDALSALGAG